MLVQAQSGLPVRWLRSKVRPHNKSFKGTTLRLRLRRPLTPALGVSMEAVHILEDGGHTSEGVRQRRRRSYVK